MGKTVLAVGLNPVMQKTLILKNLWENEVNRSNRYFLNVAGKGANTARVLTQLGTSTFHLTHAGGIFAGMFKTMLQEDNVQCYCVDSESEIRFCYTLLNENRHTVTEIVEEALPVAPETDQALRERFLSLLPDSDIITISGTKAAGYSENIVPWMVEKGTSAGKRVIIDVCGKDLLDSIQFKPYIIKPNMKEFAETLFPDETFREHGSEKTILEIAKEKITSLYQRYGIITVITRGTEPVLYSDCGEIREKCFIPVTPVNTIGSGDSFTAGLAHGISRNLSISQSIDIAIDCGIKNALNLKPGSIQ